MDLSKYLGNCDIVNGAVNFLVWVKVFCVEFVCSYISLVASLNFSDGLILTIFSMLYAFLVIFFAGYRLGNVGSGVFGFSVTLFALIILSGYIWFSMRDFWSLYFFSDSVGSGVYHGFQILEVPVTRVTFGNWISCSMFELHWGFIFDPLSVSMMWVVLFVTFIVQIYCLDYMFFDPFFSKFYSYLSVFSFFMLFLVASDNYLQVFLGWEGVGLASFMLISFWSSRKDAVSAGMKAMFINRFGDLFFILAMVVCLSQFGTLNFESVKFFMYYDEVGYVGSTLNLLSLSLVLAAMAKSAQLGLHMWLPDAMEGPTPVSALIHAATMVTAGIFVLIRSSFILVSTPDVLSFMIFMGGLTALFGASVACVQFDIKKVIAYSTCSQLGYMMLACGSGNFVGAFFHLINHAFFKALLFLGAGSVIHAVGNEQDMRKMGALANFLPVTFFVMTIGSAALAGFPFLSGFYSKDYILEFTYSVNSSFSLVGFFYGSLAAFCTSAYSFRLLYLVFPAPYQGPRSVVSEIHEAPKFMLFALTSLAIPSVFFGYIFSGLFIGDISSQLWQGCVTNSLVLWLVFPAFVQQIPTILSLCGFLSGYLFYVSKLKVLICASENSFGRIIYMFLIRKWYFDDLFTFVIHGFMFINFNYFWKYFEQGFLVYFGPIGIGRVFAKLSSLSDFWSISVPLVYLKSFFYFLLVLICIWFIATNFTDYIVFILIIQVIGIFYYLFSLYIYIEQFSDPVIILFLFNPVT